MPGVLLQRLAGDGKDDGHQDPCKGGQGRLLNVSGADFLSKWVGKDEKIVRAVFLLAHKLGPCVSFVDKADAVFRCRSETMSLGGETSFRSFSSSEEA